MSSSRDTRGGRSAVDLVGEAVHLLRTAPLSTLALYYIGALPFVIGLLFFWSDMSRSAFARERCFAAALALAMAFAWMKVWHAAFAGRLLDRVSGIPARPWGMRRVLNVLGIQLAVQPYGLIVLPVALLFTIPFLPLYAFYQGLSAFGDGRLATPRDTVRASWRQAIYDSRQNVILVWLVSPWLLAVGLLFVFGTSRLVVSIIPELQYMHGVMWFMAALAMMVQGVVLFCPLGCVVAGNIALVLVAAPSLLRSVLGIQTTFSLSGWHAIFNTTFLFTVFALTTLCLDPLAKAAYTLRCFYGASVRSGDDLRVELSEIARRGRRAGAILLIVASTLCGVFTAAADDGVQPAEPAAAGELDARIDDTLSHPLYSWRSPRDRAVADHGPGAIGAFIRDLGEAVQHAVTVIVTKIGSMIEWLLDHLRWRPRQTAQPSGWREPVRLLLLVLLAATASLTAVFVCRHIRRRRKHREPVVPRALNVPDLEDADTTAGELPSDEWSVLASNLLKQGELRQALRALFFACLARLAEQGRLDIARHKSNRDYARELERRAEPPQTVDAFRAGIRTVEETWYGAHEPTGDTWRGFENNLNRIMGHGATI